MFVLKIVQVLSLSLLVLTANARPDGYGVKGGRNHKSTANAAASAQATANAGGFGIAQSSAIATAKADANGGTSNAGATANASVHGENIGKVISSDDANTNVNGPGDSHNLGQSNNHGKDQEYDSINRGDQTPDRADRYPGHVIPSSTKNHAIGCTGEVDTSGTKNNPNYANPFPTQHEDFDLTVISNNPEPIDGGYGGNSGNPGIHAGITSCKPGDTKCVPKPPVSNPHPTYEPYPDLSGGREGPGPIDGGYEGNSGNPGSHNGISSCQPGDTKCVPKPHVSIPHQTHEKNPDLSGGRDGPGPIDGGYEGNSGNPGSHTGISSCQPGGTKCVPKPPVSNPHPTYEPNPDLSGGREGPGPIDGGYEGNSGFPGSHTGIHLCLPGDTKCVPKPPVSNPHSTHEKNPNLSGGRDSPKPTDGGYGENSGNPENHAGISSCKFGDTKCVPKPPVSNPHPAHEKNPDLLGGRDGSEPIHGGYGGNSGNPESHVGINSCLPGNTKCVPKPPVSNPHPTHEKNPDLSGGREGPEPIDSGYGGNCAHSSIIGGTKVDPCTPGVSERPSQTIKPSVSNLHPTYHQNPGSSIGAGQSSNEPHPSGPVGKKPNTSNPFLNGEIDVSGINNPGKPSGGSGHPPPTPNPSNPFLNPHNQLPMGTKPPGYPHENQGRPATTPEYPRPTIPSGLPEIKPNPSNPFLNPHNHFDQPKDTKTPGNPNGSYDGHSSTPKYPHEDSSSSSILPEIKPNPSNPFLFNHGNPDSTTGTNHPSGTGSVIQTTEHNIPETKPVNSNPFLVGSVAKPNVTPETDSHGPGIPTHVPNHDNVGSAENSGVKTSRPGVKGGSRHHGSAGHSDRNFGLQSGHPNFGNNEQVNGEAAANAFAGAYANAHASSSSANQGGHSFSSANAKSAAHHGIGSSGWGSGEASASASASANSGNSNQHHGSSILPDVPAQ